MPVGQFSYDDEKLFVLGIGLFEKFQNSSGRRWRASVLSTPFRSFGS